MARLLASLLFLPLLGCGGDPDTATCELDIEAVVELPPGQLCALTPSGLLLRLDSERGAVVLDRLGAHREERSELAVIPGEVAGCGALAEDPATNTVWLTTTAPAEPDAVARRRDTLHQLDADGRLLTSELLAHEGLAVSVGGLAVRDGALFVAGAVIDETDTEWGPQTRYRALLERRDGTGAIEWTRIGYAGANPAPWTPGVGFDGLGSAHAHATGLASLAYNYGIDSAQISLLVVDQHGEPRWTDLVTRDNYHGPHPRLASDGDRSLYIAEERQAVLDYDVEHNRLLGILRPPRSIVTGLSVFGSTLWRGEVEWPGFDELYVSNPVVVGTDVYVTVWDAYPEAAHDQDTGPHQVGLARHDWTGALDCRAWLTGFGLRATTRLQALADGRVVVLATLARAAETGSAQDVPALILIRGVSP